MQRQRDRRDLGRRAKPQIDPLDIAVGGPFLQQLDQAPSDPNGGFTGLVASPPRQRFGVEHEKQVDIGRIIELAAAKLAHGDDGKALRFGIGHAFPNCRVNRLADRASAKSDSNRVTSSKGNSPARSPSATARARPWRLSRSSASKPSLSAESACSAAAALP